MAVRIEVASRIPDARAAVLHRRLAESGFPQITNVHLADVYTLDAGDAALSDGRLEAAAQMLANPITENAGIGAPLAPKEFSWAIEAGFLPGVTDNAGVTAKQCIGDLPGSPLSDGQMVYSSRIVYLSGDQLSEADVQAIAAWLINPLIQSAHVKSAAAFRADGGMGIVVPRVKLSAQPAADIVDLFHMTDDELATLGKQGIPNADGTRRGPLALSLAYLHTIREYFKNERRNPTDVELESIAQTWSEHCKHTIFRDPIGEIKEGLFRRYIKGATDRIREERSARGLEDICVSVFTDNSGAIVFDGRSLITNKVETHNSPSALDPFGGSITGIVGVNRDTLGFGIGAEPVINHYGFCLAHPGSQQTLYRGKNTKQPLLSARRIMDGVIEGVNVGGNCSGIPTPQGFVYFDERYRGKPLVFVGTVGLIPREVNGRPSYEKKAQPGDYIVMVGGRVGKDGIHGATFSSAALDEGSPATAVQIGNPITQKKLSDALVKEARDRGLYRSITDNGAGGLSCSVAEMAQESGGCEVELAHVPLKYAGLAPWEIWVSEAQERMTLAVPQDKWWKFRELMQKHDVEATIIGKFTSSGRCVVRHNEATMMNIELDFLHDGLPPREQQTSYTQTTWDEPSLPQLDDFTESLHAMLGRPNIASYAFISEQYDHEVQGGSVLKPLQGRGRVNGDATIVRPVLASRKGVVLSQGINPAYSDIDTYRMAAAAIDTAIRRAVAAGADLEHLALLDNFCWCSSDEPERLGQLEAAARACYDIAVAFGAPFISGKDSMFNDFKGYDENGNPIKISVPPTLLITAIGVMEDATRTVSLDAKVPGDLVYVLGETHNELGGSEYFAMLGEQERGKPYIGNAAPQVNAEQNRPLYEALSRCIKEGIIASAQSADGGGLGIALAKMAMGGMLGIDVSIGDIPGTASSNHALLFSQSQGRVVVTVAPEDKKRFEEAMRGNAFAMIGAVQNDEQFTIRGKESSMLAATTVGQMLASYHSTFEGY